MVFWETFQKDINILLSVLAALTAVLGAILTSHLYKNKSRPLFNNVFLLIFTFLTFGYVCYALAELSFYLIFEAFGQMPVVSMPDFYWFVGSISLLTGFIIFSIHLYKQQRETNKMWLVFGLGGAVLSLLLYYILSTRVIEGSQGAGKSFFGYFYPIISALILIASLNVYWFLEKVEKFGASLLYLLVANAAFFLGDLLFTYYSFKGGYGIVGALSDFCYAGAYLLFSLAFYVLIKNIRKGWEETGS